MKLIIRFRRVLLFLLLTIFCLKLIANEIKAQLEFTNFLEVKGNYFGQKPPGLTPQIFAPGIISRDDIRVLNSVFSPDGSEFFFNTSVNRNKPNFRYVMQHTKRINGVWQKPKVASFSGIYSDVDMSFSLDGNKLYFRTNRFSSDHSKMQFVVSEKNADDWSSPKLLEFPVPSDELKSHPLFDKKGSVYFASSRAGGYTSVDMYYSKYEKGSYAAPVNLGKKLNSEFDRSEVVVDPDGKYMLFNIGGREDTIGRGDIYISFNQGDGSWSELIHTGPKINVANAANFCPAISADGKYIFFTRSLPESSKIYWVSAEIVDSFRGSKD